jgi:hypothetical protein
MGEIKKPKRLFPVTYSEDYGIFNGPDGQAVLVLAGLPWMTKAAKLALAKEVERKLNEIRDITKTAG